MSFKAQCTFMSLYLGISLVASPISGILLLLTSLAELLMTHFYQRWERVLHALFLVCHTQKYNSHLSFHDMPVSGCCCFVGISYCR